MTSPHLATRDRYRITISVRGLYVEIFSAFLDFHVDAGPLRHGDDHIFVEARFSGTQAADWAGIPSTGRSFNTRVACLYEFEGDQLVCERVYMNFGEIAAQLGGTICVNDPHESLHP